MTIFSSIICRLHGFRWDSGATALNSRTGFETTDEAGKGMTEMSETFRETGRELD